MDNSWLQKSAVWAKDLAFADLPQFVIESAKNQVISILAAMLAGYQSAEGRKISVSCGLGSGSSPGQQGDPRFWTDPLKAVFLLSSWSMVHDYDDVMLGGHTGHSSVIVPLVLALTKGGSGRDIILAQVVANEVAARLNLACALGQTRGQMASHLHLAGAALARAKFEDLPAEQMADCVAFALASPAKLSLPAFLGSDAKFFCASWPVRIGWEAVDCVRAGLRSSQDIVEGAFGFFSANAANAQPALLGALGTRWFTTTNSFKPYPACGYISAAIDCVLDILDKEAVSADAIEKVVVEANMFTYGVERLSRPYLKGASSSLATLSFSPAFVIASTLFYGEITPENFTSRRVENPALWRLVEKIQVRHSREQTSRSLFSGIPIGVILNSASWRAAKPFLHDFNRLVFKGESSWRNRLRDVDLWLSWFLSRKQSVEDFHHLAKPLGGKVQVVVSGGKAIAAERAIPRGFAGDSDWIGSRRLMQRKFYRCAEPVLDGRLINDCWSLLDKLESATHADLRRVVVRFGARITTHEDRRTGS